MKDAIVTLYTLKELSEKAQERAWMDWISTGGPSDYSDENTKTLDAFASVFPVRIRYYRNDHGIDFTETEEVENLTGPRLAAYIWNNYKNDLYKGKYYSKAKKNRRSKIILESCCPLTGYYMDDCILQPIMDFLKKPLRDINFRELLGECIREYDTACENEADYQASKEAFEDYCDANDCLFLATGDDANFEYEPVK